MVLDEKRVVFQPQGFQTTYFFLVDLKRRFFLDLVPSRMQSLIRYVNRALESPLNFWINGYIADQHLESTNDPLGVLLSISPNICSIIVGDCLFNEKFIARENRAAIKFSVSLSNCLETILLKS